MTHDLLITTVRMLHILAGVLWVGGAVYAGAVVGRSLSDAPPQVRGPAMGRIGPLGFRVLSWAGAATIVFGIALQVLMARADLDIGPRWHMTLGIALLLALTMMGIAGAVIGPSLRKMAAGPTPEQAAAITGRLMKASMANMALGVLAVLLMVYATALRI